MADTVAELKPRIDKTLEDLKRELAKVRTGRASTAILDGIRVDQYGTPTPLAGVASINAPEPRLITIKPWDKGVLKDIEKALREANLGINPMNDGEMIRLPFPPLTEERRKEIVKQVKTKAEDHKVAIRNHRRDILEALKTQQKDKKITEDDLKRFTKDVEDKTAAGIKQVDTIFAEKEKEVLKV
ncbi:ribosome recycling factor [Corallococcus praedator]|uniref:Ribosome-recycling factor n=2 Tax=Corallococcus TaxID=83461 RepID=A0ABR9PKK6_9BACT|nr:MULTISPECIES: ribosome recycling factor [Corallococcus]RYZ44029.1 MAG: ribosome recycling factor [Myxococcaceae bacterium]MBE4748471.1 ribosome recycling factor [Corallococcus soli]MCY1034742.1 ribosome recycling factor [Corallococcus sp. BB11-1]RKH02917.1 ribosome recycling factor [Corallococcus sp. CA047B]RKH18098.1 ribosome recycling factor [Corallococcus sp. CA031C]